ncbi:MAG TPA: hypothetical protein VHQ47_10085 [Phycisphaerae bacterium]|nr:hypothetical protein [Phycisphaerae bacterium]
MRRFVAWPVAAVMAVACAGAAWGQAAGGNGGFDREAFVGKLARGEAGAGDVAGLPSKALGPLYDAWMDNGTPARAKAALGEGLVKLHERVREEKSKALESAMRAWYERSGPAVYGAGKHDGSQGDVLGAKALKEIIDKPEDAFALAKAAVDAGSEDALVWYYYQSRMPDDWPREKAAAATVKCEKLWEKAAYPEDRRMYALLRCAAALSWPENAEAVQQAHVPAGEAQRLFTEAMGLLPKIAAEKPGMPYPADLLNLAELVSNRLDKNDGTTTFNRVFPAFNKAFPNNAQVLAYAATFYTRWAWEARGNGVASTVTDGGWQRFNQRLDQAEKYVKQSVAADPAAADGPTAMLTIAVGKEYPREEMEEWFTRAMNANPNNFTACEAKLNYLLPQWYGSAEECLAFGRECAEHGSGVSRIPLILVEAHRELRALSEDQAAYMKDVRVWADIQSAYDKVLDEETGKVPEKQVRIDRGQYLEYAAECEQWGDFLDLANKFGDDVDMEVVGGKAKFDYYKRKAAQAADKG